MNEHFIRGVREAVQAAASLVPPPPPTPPPSRTISEWSGETKESKQRTQDWRDYAAGLEVGRLLAPKRHP